MTIFNPWVILGFILAMGSAATGGYFKGMHSEQDRQKLVVAALNQEARQKEQALVSAVQTQAVQLVKANNDAKAQIAKRNSDIDSGSYRLRIPIKTPVCPVHAAGDPAPASGTDTGTAELQPEVAKDILTIGDEADTTARKLNTCIAAYNQIRETLKGKQ